MSKSKQEWLRLYEEHEDNLSKTVIRLMRDGCHVDVVVRTSNGIEGDSERNYANYLIVFTPPERSEAKEIENEDDRQR